MDSAFLTPNSPNNFLFQPIPKPAERHDGSQEEEEEEEDPVTTVVPQGSPNNQNKPMNTDKSGESHVPESDKDNQNNDLSKSPVSSQAEVMPATGETKSRNISEKRTSMNSVADSLQRAKDASSEETAHSTRPAPHQGRLSMQTRLALFVTLPRLHCSKLINMQL